MIAGHTARGALPTEGTGISARHRQVGPGFIDEEEPLPIQSGHLPTERPPFGFLALGSPQAFFSPQTQMLQRPTHRRDMDWGLGLCLQIGRQFRQRGVGALCHLPA